LNDAYQERIEEGMSGESEQTEHEVGDVIPHFRIRADLLQVPRESTRVAHDTQQMDPLQHHLTTTITNQNQLIQANTHDGSS